MYIGIYLLRIHRLHHNNLTNNQSTLARRIQCTKLYREALQFILEYKYFTVCDHKQINLPLSQHWEVQEDHWHLCCWKTYKVTQMSDQETRLSFLPSLDPPWTAGDFVLSVSLGRKSLLLWEKITGHSLKSLFPHWKKIREIRKLQDAAKVIFCLFEN